MMAYEIWLSVMDGPKLAAHALGSCTPADGSAALRQAGGVSLLRGKLWCAHEDDVAGSANFGEQAGDAALQLAALLSARDEQA